mmetsp:Transcript_52719/g.94128  ORF Transcript_52719/g.94128 Transcript_52719/m.94128 type:complete len:94 (-) Transcript_52719:297-578(-)
MMVHGLMMSWKMPARWMRVSLRISMKLQQIQEMMNIVLQHFHQTHMQKKPLVVGVPPLEMSLEAKKGLRGGLKPEVPFLVGAHRPKIQCVFLF